MGQCLGSDAALKGALVRPTIQQLFPPCMQGGHVVGGNHYIRFPSPPRPYNSMGGGGWEAIVGWAPTILWAVAPTILRALLWLRGAIRIRFLSGC